MESRTTLAAWWPHPAASTITTTARAPTQELPRDRAPRECRAALNRKSLATAARVQMWRNRFLLALLFAIVIAFRRPEH
jgi:hypothetical protein